MLECAGLHFTARFKKKKNLWKIQSMNRLSLVITSYCFEFLNK